MTNIICNECETVAHCMKNGCIPKQQALNKMADNARELRLDYEQPTQQCVACEGKPSQENNPCAVCGKPAQPEQEPVTVVKALPMGHGHRDMHYVECQHLPVGTKLYTAQPAQQEPVALKWQQSPIRTAWGDDMVVASVAIDNDHTLSLYCERDQTPKVDAMFAQRIWVGLTDEERDAIFELHNTRLGGWDYSGDKVMYYGHFEDAVAAIEAKLKEKNA